MSLAPGDDLDDRLGDSAVVHMGVVGSLLHSNSTGNTHGKSNIGGLEGGAIVRAVFRSSDSLTKSTRTSLSSGPGPGDKGRPKLKAWETGPSMTMSPSEQIPH